MTQNMNGPDPNNLYPIEGNKEVHFIKPTLTKSNIEVPLKGNTVIGNNV